MAIRQYIGARYVTKIYENSQFPDSAEWEAGVNYEPLVMVTYNNGSYLSKKTVPANIGDPAANPSYWVQTGFYNGQILSLQSQIDAINVVLTPAASKINNMNIVNVRDYGAVGDGSTDDLQAFIDAIDAAPIHSTVYIPSGTYLLSDQLVIEKPVALIGEYNGWDFGTDQMFITRDEAMATSIISHATTGNKGAIVIKQNGVRIENISIYVNGTASTHGILIPATSGYNPGSDAIRNIIIKNVALFLNRDYRTGTYITGIRSEATLICSEIDHVWTYNYPNGMYFVRGDALKISNSWVIEPCNYGYQFNDVKYSVIDSCACDCGLDEGRVAYGYMITNGSYLTFEGCGAEGTNLAAFYITNSKVSMNGCSSYEPNKSGNTSGGLCQLQNGASVTMIGSNVAPKTSPNNLIAAQAGTEFNIFSCEYDYLMIGTTSTNTPNATYIKNNAV